MQNKSKKIKYTILYSFHIPLLILAAIVLVAGALSYSVNKKQNDTSVLGSKANSNANSNSAKVKVNTNNSGKSSQIKVGTTPQSKKHQEIMSNVITGLEEVAANEEQTGNTLVSDEITEVADTSETVASDTVEAIDEIESRPAWKVTLLGPDYKNLGQLRSALAHNDNAFRALIRANGEVTPDNVPAVQEQLTNLEQERERIYNIVRTEESRFSLLGWVSRFLLGYTPISSGEDDLIPSPTPTSTVTATPTPEASPTDVVSPTPTVTPSDTPTPTPTPTETPTPTVTIEPEITE